MKLSPLLFCFGMLISLCATGQNIVPESLSECKECHLLSAPEYDVVGHAERLTRKAPPLFYAGNKYKRNWLEEWLIEPDRIHPVGYMPAVDRVVAAPEGDVVPSEALVDHPRATKAEAVVIADALMELRPYDALAEAVAYEPGAVALRLGALDFRRFKGCDACHRDTPDNGGLSGPELTTAWQRLQPSYIAAFIADPVAWDRNTIMPVPQMNEAAVHKLADYLRALGDPQ